MQFSIDRHILKMNTYYFFEFNLYIPLIICGSWPYFFDTETKGRHMGALLFQVSAAPRAARHLIPRFP